MLTKPGPDVHLNAHLQVVGGQGFGVGHAARPVIKRLEVVDAIAGRVVLQVDQIDEFGELILSHQAPRQSREAPKFWR